MASCALGAAVCCALRVVLLEVLVCNHPVFRYLGGYSAQRGMQENCKQLGVALRSGWLQSQLTSSFLSNTKCVSAAGRKRCQYSRTCKRSKLQCSLAGAMCEIWCRAGNQQGVLCDELRQLLRGPFPFLQGRRRCGCSTSPDGKASREPKIRVKMRTC